MGLQRLALAVAVALALGLALVARPAAGQAATSQTTIQAVPDDSQLSSKGSQAGCDRYRNGYLGLTLCVNYYDDMADGKPFVQVVGSMTNEGVVDICNMTVAVEGLEAATYKNPAWLPKYPPKQSFKAGTYFPFTVILPVAVGTPAAYSYPAVDVLRGFYACDASLKPLPEDQVVPPPGTGRGSVEADDDYPGSTGSGLGSKINWNGGFKTAAGSNSDCLGGCLATLYKQTDDCAAAAYVLHSGCIKSCPPTVAEWTVNACTKAKCSASQCTLKTSPAPRRAGAGGANAWLAAALTVAATAAAVLGSGGGGGGWCC